jgi:hypothetical protein
MQIHIIFLFGFIALLFASLEFYRIYLANRQKRINNNFLQDSFFEITQLVRQLLQPSSNPTQTQTYTGKSFSDMQKEIYDQKLHFDKNLKEGNKTALRIWLQDSEYSEILKEWAIQTYPNNETLIEVLKAINLSDYAN